MNSKGQSLVDFEPAEPASTRRSLLGTAGLAGLFGTAAAVLSSTSAAAAPNRPTDADRDGLTAALSLELAAVELYRLAAGELPDDIAAIAMVMADQHRAYADSIAGTIGVSSAGTVNTDVVDQLSGTFTTSDPQAFGAAGRSLENTAVATHTELLGNYDSLTAVGLTASIITVESRHATVLTSLAGFSANLDEMLGNSAEALSLTGGAA
jgi:hypothetical protein